MSERYEARGWLKFAEVDDFEQGCLLEGGTSASGDDWFSGKTIEQVIEDCRAFVPFSTDDDAVQRDACDEIGRLDLSGMETDDGQEPTSAEIEQWKASNLRLWYVTYSFQIERVTRESVSLEVSNV